MSTAATHAGEHQTKGTVVTTRYQLQSKVIAELRLARIYNRLLGLMLEGFSLPYTETEKVLTVDGWTSGMR